MTYEAATADAETRMRAWVLERHVIVRDLPDDAWHLPPDCPLWHLGLSAAQAQGILAAVKARPDA